MKHCKKYNAALTLVDTKKVYSIEEACELVKKTSTVKFDATVDVSFHINVDTKQADQQIRGTLILPHGNGKTKKIVAITNTKLEEAKAAGADFAGGKELLEKMKVENWFDFDVIVATPDMMGQIGRLGRVLGPKGLMPNPKTGTVTQDVAKAVSDIKAGQVAYRADSAGNLHLPIGRVSFSVDQLLENLKAVHEMVLREKPASSKGVYLQNASVSSTMGPGIKLDTSSL